MPRGDGTGPGAPGAGGGRGRGRGPKGRGGGFAAGPGGYCVCPSCGVRVEHQLGVSCLEMKCPRCGAAMTRELPT
jgi:hypothetical protein